jgi:hypothetical protein
MPIFSFTATGMTEPRVLASRLNGNIVSRLLATVPKGERSAGRESLRVKGSPIAGAERLAGGGDGVHV